MGIDPSGKSIIAIIGLVIGLGCVAAGLSGCSSNECNAIVLRNDVDGWSNSAETMAKNLATATGSPNHRVQPVTDSNFLETWDGITEKYVAIAAHGSQTSLVGNNLVQDLTTLSSLNRNSNIKCVIITACRTGAGMGEDPDVGQLLSTKIASEGFVICCTDVVSGGGTTFSAKYGGDWVIYQNGTLVRTFTGEEFTMKDFISELRR